VAKVSREIETKILSGNAHGAFELLRDWYRKRGGNPPRPTCKDLNHIRSQFRNLYHKVDPCGDPLPVHVSPVPVNDEIPDEDEICLATKHMRRGKSPGPVPRQFVCLIYCFGMINFLTFGMNLFLLYRMFLMASQSHKNSHMRFSVLFRRRIEANIMVLLCWRSCTN
jgi:hypothetical protein